ncbi:MAG: ferrous iron transport protein A [Chitinivibrionia bacterium]|nr:ferrous iron transport protein A [Chitinivibrionia bacterium]
MSNKKTINLYAAQKKRMFKIISTPEIGLLENMGLRAGVKITLQNRYAFGGPVLLRVADAYSIALGKDIASQITVCETNDEEDKAA